LCVLLPMLLFAGSGKSTRSSAAANPSTDPPLTNTISQE
jgi:hypothetical protein